jgi:hypothetical protein
MEEVWKEVSSAYSMEISRKSLEAYQRELNDNDKPGIQFRII